MVAEDAAQENHKVSVQLCAYSDLTVVVGTDDDCQPYDVCSTALRLASPVWDRMLDPNGHFAESKEAASGKRVVALPDDPLAMFLVVLNIVHLKFQDLPETITFRNLVDLAVLCDKYDIVRIVRPWIGEWQKPHRETNLKAGFEEWLFIAWVFGETDLYKQISTKLILSTTKEDFTSEAANGLSSMILPHNAIEDIRGTRERVILSIVEACYQLVELYGSKENHCAADVSRCGHRAGEDARADCDAMVFGSLMRSMRSINLWPDRPGEDAIFLSVENLYDSVLAMKCLVPTTHTSTSHYNCGFAKRLEEDVKQILVKSGLSYRPSKEPRK